MKYKRILIIIAALVMLSCIFAACDPEKPDDGMDDGIFDNGVEAADESFFYGFAGMDQGESDAQVRLMPAPYGDIRITLNAQLLSLTADFDADCGKYVLYYCVKEKEKYNVYRTLSGDGINWDFDESKELYFSAQGVVTVVSGDNNYYIENSGGIFFRSVDGEVNIRLTDDASCKVTSAFYDRGRYLIYISDEQGSTFLHEIKNFSGQKYTVKDSTAVLNPDGKFVLNFGDKYIGFSKRSENGVNDFTVALSKNGTDFFSFNGAYITAAASPSDKSLHGWEKCDSYIANGWFDVCNDNAAQDPAAGVYVYEVKDGVTYLILYKLRKGGVAALYGDMQGATVCSGTVLLDSQEIYIDYQTGATGFIEAEIINKDGDVVFSSYIARGNSICKSVLLDSDAVAALSTGAKIRFRLYDAYLYRVYTEEGSL